MGIKALSTVLKSLEVLDVVSTSAGPLKSIDVARKLGQSPATIYQRLSTLEMAGWVERTEDNRFRLSFRVVSAAGYALEQAGLGERVEDVLNRVAATSAEAVSLSVLEGSEMLIVRRIEARGPVRSDLRIGARLSLARSASGLAYVAFCSPEKMELFKDLNVTLPDSAAFERTRADGYAATVLPGVRSVAAVSAPVFDVGGNCSATVTVSGPEQGFDFDKCSKLAKQAAAEITARFQGAFGGMAKSSDIVERENV